MIMEIPTTWVEEPRSVTVEDLGALCCSRTRDGLLVLEQTNNGLTKTITITTELQFKQLNERRRGREHNGGNAART